MAPEQKARVSIDALLVQAGWQLCGVSEASKEGATFTGVEVQSERYGQGLPSHCPGCADRYISVESTGIETHLTNGLNPSPGSRQKPKVKSGHARQAWQRVMGFKDHFALADYGILVGRFSDR